MARTTWRSISHRSIRSVAWLLIVEILFAGNAFAQLQNQQTQPVDEYLVMNNPKIKNTSYTIGNITVGDPSIVNFKADRKKKSHHPIS